MPRPGSRCPVVASKAVRRIAIALAFAAAFVFSVAEPVLYQAVWPAPYLDSAFFYYPGVALTAVLVLALAAFCGLLGQGLSRIRPSIDAALAGTALLYTALLYWLMARFGAVTQSWLAAGHFDVFPGYVLGFGIVAAAYASTLWLAGEFFRRRMGAVRKTSGKARNGVRLFAFVSAAVLTLSTWDAIHETYFTLYMLSVAGLLLPAFFGHVMYVGLKSRSAEGRERIARASLGLAWVFVGGFSAAYAIRHMGGVALPLAVAGLALLLAVTGFRAQSAKISLLYLPVGTLVLLLAAPWMENAWRPPISASARQAGPVFLVSVDTLRADAISAYNPEAAPTPHMDDLIYSGRRFSRAWSPGSWTLPSLVSIMTGTSPAVHRVIDFEDRAPARLPTLAELLRKRNFVTEAVVENVFLQPGRGLARGFDFYTHLPQLKPRPTMAQLILSRLWPRRFNLHGGGRAIAELGWRSLRRHRSDKLFLWLHFYDPHAPYRPPDAFWPAEVPREVYIPRIANGPDADAPSEAIFRNNMIRLYHAEVQYLDSCIGLLIDRLRQMKAWEPAWITFVSDHGEEFGEHGRWGHGGTPVEGLVRMPLAVKAPWTEAGEVSVRMADTSGFPATIMRKVDPSFRKPPSMTLAWSGPTTAKGGFTVDAVRAVFTTAYAGREKFDEGMIFGSRPWKYIYDRVGGSETLYDLQTDPDERHSVTERRPAVLERGRELYRAHRREAEQHRARLRLGEGSAVQYSSDELEELRDLGYLE